MAATRKTGYSSVSICATAVKRHKMGRLGVAYHEAGHAVVAHALGFTVTAVAIFQNDAGEWIGKTDTAYPAPSEIEKDAAVRVAGSVATHLFGAEISLHASNDDRVQLLDALARLDHHEHMRIRETAHRIAAEIIERNAAILIQVAHFLDEHLQINQRLAASLLVDVRR